MIDIDVMEKLLKAFPNSFINHNFEFIAHRYANEYFLLKDCENELDVKCKVLEWFSRGAHKTRPYRGDNSNKRFHDFMLKGINDFLNTNFTEEDIELIYDMLGNRINHPKTIKFVNSGYDMGLLEERKEV